MEYRTVLTKQKQIEQDRVEELIDGLFDRMDVYGPETGDLFEAYAMQRETLLYTMDAVIPAMAKKIGTPLVELLAGFFDPAPDGGVDAWTHDSVRSSSRSRLYFCTSSATASASRRRGLSAGRPLCLCPGPRRATPPRHRSSAGVRRRDR